MADQGTLTGAPSDVLQAGAGVPGNFELLLPCPPVVLGYQMHFSGSCWAS